MSKPYELKCPYCGSPAPLQSSTIIYKGRDYGLMYICSKYPTCDSYVGANKVTGKPSGRLANPELRAARKTARTAFDALYMNTVLDKRKQGISAKKGNAKKIMTMMLAEYLHVPENRCNINWFDLETCQKAIKFCERMKSNNEKS